MDDDDDDTTLIVPATPVRHPFHDMNTEEKFESFTLIWLDQNSKGNSLDSLRTRTLLCEINSNKNCLFYNDLVIFLNDMRGNTQSSQKILLIVSGFYAEQIFPMPTDIPDLISIVIIFCTDRKKYERLLGKYNITNICTDYDTLKSSIIGELPSLKFNLFENRSFKTIQYLTTKLHSSSIQNHDNIGAYFSYKLFIELLKEIPPTDQAKENMLKRCKDYYRYDRSEQKKIDEFAQDYLPTTAIEWYTRDSFVYRLVNRAFRTEDTALWYVFRFYIRDLCEQLEKVHREQQNHRSYVLYRGQRCVPNQELENMRTNIGGLISTNGFFSTSKSIDPALTFICNANDSDDFKVVLFEITLPADKLQNTIFVDVDQQLKQEGESEILFDIGTIFKIEQVERDESDQFWRVKMQATDEGTREIKEQILAWKAKFQKGNLNLLLGRLLLDMHQYAKADAYFQMILKALPARHSDRASIYDHIGDLHMRTTNYYSALSYFTLAYKLKRKRLSVDHPEVGVTWNHFGNYYKAINEPNEAREYYKKALNCHNDPINNAITTLNIAITLIMDGSYDEAHNWAIQACDTFDQIDPSPHTEIIMSRGVMGDLFVHQKKYDEAERSYSFAFDLCKKYLSIGDQHRTRCGIALADLYAKQDGNPTRALHFAREQLTVHEKYLSEKNHVSLAYIQMKIAQLSNEKNYYRKALDILENKIHQEYATLATCQMLFASSCEYDEALKLYTLANEIQKKIYPPHHQSIRESEAQIKQIQGLHPINSSLDNSINSLIEFDAH